MCKTLCHIAPLSSQCCYRDAVKTQKAFFFIEKKLTVLDRPNPPLAEMVSLASLVGLSSWCSAWAYFESLLASSVLRETINSASHLGYY